MLYFTAVVSVDHQNSLCWHIIDWFVLKVVVKKWTIPCPLPQNITTLSGAIKVKETQKMLLLFIALCCRCYTSTLHSALSMSRSKVINVALLMNGSDLLMESWWQYFSRKHKITSKNKPSWLLKWGLWDICLLHCSLIVVPFVCRYLTPQSLSAQLSSLSSPVRYALLCEETVLVTSCGQSMCCSVVFWLESTRPLFMAENIEQALRLPHVYDTFRPHVTALRTETLTLHPHCYRDLQFLIFGATILCDGHN